LKKPRRDCLIPTFLVSVLGLFHGLYGPASAAAIDSTHANDASTTDTDATRPFHLSSGNGLEGGQGRASYQGFRWQDSISASLNQTRGRNGFEERLDFSTSRQLKNLKNLEEGNLGATLKFDRGGFSLEGSSELNYASVIYNPLIRTEITQKSKTWNYQVSAEVAQKFTLDADSTWDWTWTGSYVEFAGKIHTFEILSEMEKDWGDFALRGELTGSRQRQDSIAGECSRYDSTGACSNLVSETITHDIGVTAGAEWSPGKHVVGFQSGVDWLFTPANPNASNSTQNKNATSAQRTWTGTAAYTYSLLSWLELGTYFQEGVNLDLKKKSKFWMLGASFTLSY
jgi:hypothetical protein